MGAKRGLGDAFMPHFSETRPSVPPTSNASSRRIRAALSAVSGVLSVCSELPASQRSFHQRVNTVYLFQALERIQDDVCCRRARRSRTSTVFEREKDARDRV